MYRIGCLVMALVIVVLWAHRGQSSPVSSVPPRVPKVAPYNYFTETRVFKGKERACVIAIGSGKTYAGLYVFDADGNCLAHDDVATSNTRDDLAVVWYPPETGPYSYEIRNLGSGTNTFEMAVR
jgi:hypothetical protein